MREMADSDVGGKIEFAITPRRWLSLFIFFGSAFNIAFQWVNYIMVPDIMCEYFSIEDGGYDKSQ